MNINHPKFKFQILTVFYGTNENDRKRVVYMHINHPKLVFVKTEKVKIVDGLFFVCFLKYLNLFLTVCSFVYVRVR